MKKFLLALALLLAPASAFAQCNGVFPSHTICGNIGATPNTPAPVTFNGAISSPGTTVVGDVVTWGDTGGTTLLDTGTPLASLLALIQPQDVKGRLTLASGVPVMGGFDCSFGPCAAQTVVYFAPNGGNRIPVWNGTTMVPYPFNCAGTNGCTTGTNGDTIGLKLDLASSANWPASSCFDLYYAYDSGTLRFGTGPAWTTCDASTQTASSTSWSVATTTLTITTLTSGAFAAGGMIYTTNASTKIPAGTKIIRQLTGTAGGAGTYQLNKTFTTATTGTLLQLGPAARANSIVPFLGVPTNAASMTLRYGAALTTTISANQATWIGTMKTDASAGAVTYQVDPVPAAGGAPCILNLWNYWNQQLTSCTVFDSTQTYTVNNNGLTGNCDNSTTYRISFVQGRGDSLRTTLTLSGAPDAPPGPGIGVGGMLLLNLTAGPTGGTGYAGNYDFSTVAGVLPNSNAQGNRVSIVTVGTWSGLLGGNFIQCGTGGDPGNITWTNHGGSNSYVAPFVIEWMN